MLNDAEEHGIVHFVRVLEPALAQKYADEVLALSHLWITQIQYFKRFALINPEESLTSRVNCIPTHIGTNPSATQLFCNRQGGPRSTKEVCY